MIAKTNSLPKGQTNDEIQENLSCICWNHADYRNHLRALCMGAKRHRTTIERRHLSRLGRRQKNHKSSQPLHKNHRKFAKRKQQISNLPSTKLLLCQHTQSLWYIEVCRFHQHMETNKLIAPLMHRRRHFQHLLSTTQTDIRNHRLQHSAFRTLERLHHQCPTS